jgi:hypothetical protein
MAHDIHIPPAALEAGARAEYEVWRHDCAGELELDLEMYRLWDQLEPDEQERWCGQARAAIAAAFNAWPGMTLHQQDINAEYSYFVLPLPQEDSDE